MSDCTDRTPRAGLSRRELLRTGLLGIGVGATVPLVFGRSALAIAASSRLEGREAHPERILVVAELAGGNDGLNTVVPYRSDAYRRARPSIAVPAGQVLRLDDELGLHPALIGMKKLWDRGRLAIVNGCGYPDPSRSHFESMEYWHTALPHGTDVRGWVGRLADAALDPAPELLVNVARSQSRALASRRHSPVVFSDPRRFARMGPPDQEPVYGALLEAGGEGGAELDFLRSIARSARESSGRVRSAVAGYRTPVSYGSESEASSLAVDLKQVAALIHAAFPTRIYYVSMGGFDTHSNQADGQRLHLMYASDALEGFMADLDRLGRAGDVAVMVFTEFGRRVEENRSGGTDHGTAGPMFVLGEPVKGGAYGAHPSLEELDSNGDLVMTTDFRRVYASLIRGWMGHPDTRSILRGDFEPLDLFAGA